jgi:hypothetical protein
VHSSSCGTGLSSLQLVAFSNLLRIEVEKAPAPVIVPRQGRARLVGFAPVFDDPEGGH